MIFHLCLTQSKTSIFFSFFLVDGFGFNASIMFLEVLQMQQVTDLHVSEALGNPQKLFFSLASGSHFSTETLQ